MNVSSTRFGRFTRFAIAVLVAASAGIYGYPPAALGADEPDAKKAASSTDSEPEGETKSEEPKVKLGLSINEPGASKGYTLIAPMQSKKTYLIDMDGRVVRTWESEYNPALSAYLLENGNLLRSATLGEEGGRRFGGMPGAGGRVQEFTWDGELIWDYKFPIDKMTPHHDLIKLPNGNVLLVVSERKSRDEALAAGRAPETLGDGDLQADCLIEVKPTGKTTGEVVWQWHVWDHLIQDRDPSKANYGDVAGHPELVDVNFGEGLGALLKDKDEVDKLRSIGYLGAANGPGPPRLNGDWTHINSVAYNPELDQVIVSSFGLSEIWIIDHSTTTKEAAGHSGGRYGKGGDLLYRWGNPQAYRAGKAEDQRLFHPHNAHWIEPGLPGAGNLLIFNNAHRGPDGQYSSVDEIVLPVDLQGNYSRSGSAAFEPKEPIWTYTAPKKTDFSSGTISGAQRLENGNTLICSGQNGTIFEVTPQHEFVWKFVNPTKGGFGPGGPGGFGRGFDMFAQFGQILPSFARDRLNLTDEQTKQIDEIQKEARQRLDKVLTEEQRKQLAEFERGGDRSPRQANFGPPRGGQANFGPPGGGGPNFGPRGGDRRRGGPGGRGPFGGPPGGSSVFRAYRYAANYPGLAGKELKPGKTLEEIAEAESKEQERRDQPAGDKDNSDAKEKQAQTAK